MTQEETASKELHAAHAQGKGQRQHGSACDRFITSSPFIYRERDSNSTSTCYLKLIQEPPPGWEHTCQHCKTTFNLHIKENRSLKSRHKRKLSPALQWKGNCNSSSGQLLKAKSCVVGSQGSSPCPTCMFSLLCSWGKQGASFWEPQDDCRGPLQDTGKAAASQLRLLTPSPYTYPNIYLKEIFKAVFFLYKHLSISRAIFTVWLLTLCKVNTSPHTLKQSHLMHSQSRLQNQNKSSTSSCFPSHFQRVSKSLNIFFCIVKSSKNLTKTESLQRDEFFCTK